jgi:bifunctional oligoribonuclease and PAP phosphatase NrnA
LANQFITAVKELLNVSSEIIILTHHNPDGDAIGSSLALWHFLKKQNYKVTVVVPNDFPDFYKWMPGVEDICIYAKENEKCLELFDKAGIIFCLDFNMTERVEALSDVLANSKGSKVLIDHHQMPSDFFKIAYSKIDTSSTSEMIYDVISGLDGEHLVDKDIATCIYVGIITDTGSFSYNCDFPNTYYVTSKIFQQGINGEEIHRLVYCTFSETRLRLLGYCLSEKMKVIDDLSTAYIAISKDDMKRFDFVMGDSEGIVNYGLTIKNIKVSALFSEKREYVKLSLRSAGDFNVGQFARVHYNGGGHLNASGANIKMSLNDAIKSFIENLSQYMDQLSR